MTASLPGSVPAAWPMGTTAGICCSATPIEPSSSVFQRPWVWSRPERGGDTGVDRPAVPEMAWVATAWQGQ